MSATQHQNSPSIGESVYASPHARIETKPSKVTGERRDGDGNLIVSRDTGGGYERIRSWEVDPTTAKDSKEDVYVAHHRLLSVVECYPMDMDLSEILSHLNGKDVHHTTGVEWANFGESPNFEDPGIAVREHDSHSTITQAEMRAYAADDKRRVEARKTIDEENTCSHCGEGSSVLCRVGSYDGGTVCLDCSKQLADGNPVEVL